MDRHEPVELPRIRREPRQGVLLRRRRLSKLTAASVALCFLTAVAAPAPAAPLQRAAGVRLRGSAWFSASVDAPPGGWIRLTLRSASRPHARTTACVLTERSGNGRSWVTGWAVTMPDSQGASMDVRSSRGVRGFHYGTPSHTPEGGSELECSIETHWPQGARSDAVAIAASDGSGLTGEIAFVAGGGARIVAESSGGSVLVLRESRFEAAARAFSSDRREMPVPQAPPEVVPGLGIESVFVAGHVGAIFGGRAEATFRRIATGVLLAAPSPAGAFPALLSIDEPDGAPLGARYGLDRIDFWGPPGRYAFGIEALLGPFAYGSFFLAGKPPVVLLVAADADLPACTVRSRIVRRARDGHPICAA